MRQAIKKILPFHPTAAQKRVLKEIAEDMQKPYPMRRLLQGDVGSGKTIVSFQAAIIAIENGYQVALMAPTEILAQQHYFSARRILENAGYRIVLLTGSLEADRKREIRRHIAQGNAQLVIGTHALLEEKVEFAKPGLVIVDEQHRFGVLQRLKLMKKSGEREDEGRASLGADEGVRRSTNTVGEPDVLVMTATPIPRTLALTLYGDLDISVLDELPPGRTPIVTRRITDDRSTEVWDFVRKQVAKGHQVYVVYPVIAESEETELKAAIKMYRELSGKIFSDLKVGLLHGRLDADLKDQVMRMFQKGELQILVATTVIEVGVDVPNATVMVIEHAERFGLAQLHQLRGRIGRGAAKSFCILMTGGKVTEEGERRLDAMVRTNDGFQIAELDLELRGPGEFFGTRQAGLPNFRVANLIRDRQLLELAKREAAAVMAGPEFGSHAGGNQPGVGCAADALAAHLRAGGSRLMQTSESAASIRGGTSDKGLRLLHAAGERNCCPISARWGDGHFVACTMQITCRISSNGTTNVGIRLSGSTLIAAVEMAWGSINGTSVPNVTAVTRSTIPRTCQTMKMVR